ncbi:acetate--CoA ligase family protein [Achromobacter anxifer]|uniref:acetate--CoA ligase family protein n=1 Tax=Achromobacter anxifer TaxID=1287737 RepID=UPI0023F88441|nr:acetate--CoA ligase family protein [Achromobacter anxifer]MDF8365156.1 acetate--CoA ligase family protein [Achromobacter anxifer]
MSASPSQFDPNVRFDDLVELTRPRSVMIVGASSKPGTLGHTTVVNVLEHSDFDGEVYLVNPKGGELFGKPLHASVAAVPAQGIDVALLLVPAESAVDTLRACADKGVRYVIVFTGGFAELGEAGRTVEAEMLALAQRSGMRLYGPNCAGMTMLAPRLGLTFSTEFRNDGRTGKLSRIGLVTQGGGLGRSLMQGNERGVCFSRWFSTGNELDLDSADFINWLAHDPGTDLICTVMEGIRSGPRFIAAAAAARRAGKPLIALKIGRSDFGKKAAQSHTASLAGEDAVNDAVFSQYGVIRVEDLDELLDVASLISRVGARSLRNICVYSSSGGAGVLSADKVGEAGLAMAVLADETVAEMARHAPSYAALTNPVDLTTKALTDPDLARRCLAPLFADPGVDAVLYPITSNYSASTEGLVRNMLAVAQGGAKAFVPVWMSSRRGPAHDLLIQEGFAPVYSLRNAMLALKRVSGYAAQVAQAVEGVEDAAPAGLPAAAPAVQLPCNEAQAKALLAQYGVRAPRESQAATAEEAAAAARAIGFPVALKLVADGVLHKSEIGGVQLGLRDEAEVRAAFERILANAARHQVPAAAIRGALVSEMVVDGVEMLVGLHRDEVFGPVLSVGAGGVWVEVDADVARCHLPASRQQIEHALDQTRIARRLASHRGLPARDRAALVDAVQRIAALFTALGDGVQSLEVNPLVVLNAGRGVVALDAVIE